MRLLLFFLSQCTIKRSKIFFFESLLVFVCFSYKFHTLFFSLSIMVKNEVLLVYFFFLFCCWYGSDTRWRVLIYILNLRKFGGGRNQSNAGSNQYIKAGILFFCLVCLIFIFHLLPHNTNKSCNDFRYNLNNSNIKKKKFINIYEFICKFLFWCFFFYKLIN